MQDVMLEMVKHEQIKKKKKGETNSQVRKKMKRAGRRQMLETNSVRPQHVKSLHIQL